MNTIRGTIFASTVLALAACGTPPYMQTPLVVGAKATVKLPKYEGGFPNLHIHKIDDVHTPTLARKFEVSAGAHDLILSCQYTGAFGMRAYFGRVLLNFEAKAEHAYEARIKKVDKRRCDIQLVDKTTKTVVSRLITREQDYRPR
ncbi:MAG: hypothetical protein R3268_03540 [Acidiferrobacterales bacterium]|nr:hypothetical protein [Acidiferrobacterales bacterium]